VPLLHTGLNLYKMVEMFAKYRPVVPAEFQSDELYAEPSKEVYSKVNRLTAIRVLARSKNSRPVGFLL